MPRKTPQQKKGESYLKDRRNTYGENAKSSRKNIARNKDLRRRAARRLGREAFRAGTELTDPEKIDKVEARLELQRRKAWKKLPDNPLGVVISRKRARRERLGMNTIECEQTANKPLQPTRAVAAITVTRAARVGPRG